MRCHARLGAGPILALSILAAASPAPGQRVELDAVPTPVLDAVRARFKDARLTGADRGVQEGTAAYEIAIRYQGRSIDVIVTPQGRILLIKREITAEDLPASVIRALAQAYPGATYGELEAVFTVQGVQETLAHYEVLLVTGERRVEVRVSPDGQIASGVR